MENTTVEQAKKVLKEAGYFVDNLWQVQDVQSRFKCTDEEAQEVLSQALENEHTMEQIWYAIGHHAEDNGLTEIEY